MNTSDKDFEHFLSYSGFSKYNTEIVDSLRVAYQAGLNDNKPSYAPYAIEAGWSNGDGTYSIKIKRLPLSNWDKPVKDWPQKTLYRKVD